MEHVKSPLHDEHDVTMVSMELVQLRQGTNSSSTAPRQPGRRRRRRRQRQRQDDAGAGSTKSESNRESNSEEEEEDLADVQLTLGDSSSGSGGRGRRCGAGHRRARQRGAAGGSRGDEEGESESDDSGERYEYEYDDDLEEGTVHPRARSVRNKYGGGARRPCIIMMVIAVGSFLVAMLIGTYSPPSLAEAGQHPKWDICYLLLDDFGYNDAPWVSTDLSSAMPNFRRLATEGVILSRFYTAAVCTPSRASLLTGRYAMRLGLQHSVLKLAADDHLPLDEVLLSEKLQANGYATMAVGKWHLGFATVDATPLYRGFDRFNGYYNGAETYTTHTTIQGEPADLSFYDYHDQSAADPLLTAAEIMKELDVSVDGTHSVYTFDNAAQSMLYEHNQSAPIQPYFLYYSMQAPHWPTTPPVEYEGAVVCQGVPDEVRRRFCELVHAADDAIGRLVSTMDALANDRATDFLLIVSGDNGADVSSGGSNWPLRGVKGSLREGGVRNNCVLHSSAFPTTWHGREYPGLVHLVDMHAMVMGRANAAAKEHRALDGIDFYDDMAEYLPHSGHYFDVEVGARDRLLINFDELGSTAPLLESGAVGSAAYMRRVAVGADGKQHWLKLCVNLANESRWSLPTTWNATADRATASAPVEDVTTDLNTTTGVQLFDLSTDPHESHDLAPAREYAALRHQLLEELRDQVSSADYRSPIYSGGGADAAAARSVCEAAGGWVPWLL